MIFSGFEFVSWHHLELYSNQTVEMNETKCELAFQLTYHPIYRLSQFYTFSISVLAAPALLYLMVKKLFRLHFHGNLKTLLIAYLISIFLYAVIVCFDFGYHFFVPFFVTSKCNLIIDKSLYKYIHVPTLFLLTTPMMFPIGFSIERFIAVGMSCRYEKTPTLLGPILPFLLPLPNILIFYSIFKNEKYDDSFISFLMLPNTSAVQFNNYIWYLLYLKIGNLVLNFFLLLMHRRLKTRYLLQKSSLSMRYAMEEILQSSKFTLAITFTHLLFFGTYTICSILVRVLGEPFFDSFINHSVARGVNCAIPTYNLVIVLVSFQSLRHLNSKRYLEVQTTVQLKTTGDEGARNYEEATINKWATITSGRMGAI
ncbi:CRE-SRB-13 protein [Caenorhabditis remanei]|uniref:CRE-SRB-13 protein n=1 Tax=Caenorhabditis remanei TaxID=31234 RepID=E3M4G2_CAERE|nr:CRE-SRB-13 protein [Caenorhabditis remanei]